MLDKGDKGAVFSKIGSPKKSILIGGLTILGRHKQRTHGARSTCNRQSLEHEI